MIYLTVGTYPSGFDRLVRAVDDLCLKYGVECISQISGGSYKPRNMPYQAFYSTEQQNEYIKQSQFVIAHGGFGVIGDIMRASKPLLVFPRPTGEGPNDQRPVAKRLAYQYGFSLCNDISELKMSFSDMLESTQVNPDYQLGSNIPVIISDYLSGL